MSDQATGTHRYTKGPCIGADGKWYPSRTACKKAGTTVDKCLADSRGLSHIGVGHEDGTVEETTEAA